VNRRLIGREHLAAAALDMAADRVLLGFERIFHALLLGAVESAAGVTLLLGDRWTRHLEDDGDGLETEARRHPSRFELRRVFGDARGTDCVGTGSENAECKRNSDRRARRCE